MRTVAGMGGRRSSSVVALCAVVLGIFGSTTAWTKSRPGPSADLAALPMAIVPEYGEALRTAAPVSPAYRSFAVAALSEALVDAGYRVMQAGGSEGLRIQMSLVTSQVQIPFLMNGRNGFTTRVDVSIALMAVTDQRYLAGASDWYLSDDGQAKEKVFKKLVEKLTADGRLEAYATEFKQYERDRAARAEAERREAAARAEREQKELAARRVAEEKAAAERERQADEDAWSKADADACRAPKKPDACGPLEAYKTQHPSGAHVAEAVQIISDAQPQLAALVDVAAWRDANAAGCRIADASDACDGVTAYVAAHDDGAHVAEARTLLKLVAPKLAIAKKREEAEANAADTISDLCQVLTQEDQVLLAKAQQREIDRASGTINLTQRRQLATATIVLGQRKRQFLKTLHDAGVKFEPKRQCDDQQ